MLPGVDHKFARVKGDALIVLFLCGQDEEFQAAMGCPGTDVLENQY